MPTAPLPPNEEQRLAVLHTLDILNDDSDPNLDHITELAQDIFAVPTALVSLVDAKTQCFKSRQGFTPKSTPRDIAFCGFVVSDNAPLVVENALEDARFADNPLVTGEPHIRFYAGVPIYLHNRSLPLGTLCVIDDKPRHFGPADQRRLALLASQVEAILHQYELNQSLQQARDEAVAYYHAKSRFLAKMNHELRTPLNAIMGFSDLLLKSHRHPLSDPQHRQVKKIRRSGEHLLTLVNDVLDLSRLEVNALPVNPEPLDVVEVVNEIMDSLSADMEAQGLACYFAPMNHAGSEVMADPTRLRQVLYNLISNAIKYNRPGGSVKISLAIQDHKARIGVEDSGPGIAPEQHSRLFEVFDRLDADGDAPGGSGIGLPIAKELVNKMNGEMGVESEPDKGSCFWFTLPLADARA
ncbi:sensor histidine kinase [Vreelandella massiliensis]|uniref:sensor histidine kinase n=1 Tax=Vreelandella massiliensis TaxID=1816686 RepID=UPI00096A4D26|nr:GAF domain-containing sensor histidine kinase [Halomonas massiliensis]